MIDKFVCGELKLKIGKNWIFILWLGFFRIRASNILIVGISGLGAEIAKNLILAGPRAVTLMDDCEISENDSLSQFLIRSNVNKVNVG
jgi:molybdopterin/thiamine biosynthesis adenylyltransferase